MTAIVRDNDPSTAETVILAILESYETFSETVISKEPSFSPEDGLTSHQAASLVTFHGRLDVTFTVTEDVVPSAFTEMLTLSTSR